MTVGEARFLGEYVLITGQEIPPPVWPEPGLERPVLVGPQGGFTGSILANDIPIFSQANSALSTAAMNFAIWEGESWRYVSTDNTYINQGNSGYGWRQLIDNKFYTWLEVYEVGNPHPIAIGTQTYDFNSGEVNEGGIIPTAPFFIPPYFQYPIRNYEYVDSDRGPYCITIYNFSDAPLYQYARFYASGAYEPFWIDNGSVTPWYFDARGFAWDDAGSYYKAALWPDALNQLYPRIMRVNDTVGRQQWDIKLSRKSDDDYWRNNHLAFWGTNLNSNCWPDGQGFVIACPDLQFGGRMFFAFDRTAETYSVYRIADFAFKFNGGLYRHMNGDFIVGANYNGNANPNNYRLNRMTIFDAPTDNLGITHLPAYPLPCYFPCIPLLKEK